MRRLVGRFLLHLALAVAVKELTSRLFRRPSLRRMPVEVVALGLLLEATSATVFDYARTRADS